MEQYSYATRTNEEWNTVQCSFVMQLVQMRFDSHSGTQGATLNYHGNKAFQVST